MNNQEKSELKAETERKIEELLRNLEEKTGDNVRDLCVKCINTQKVNEQEKQYLRYVEIDMDIKFYSRWAGQ